MLVCEYRSGSDGYSVPNGRGLGWCIIAAIGEGLVDENGVVRPYLLLHMVTFVSPKERFGYIAFYTLITDEED